MAGFRPRIGEIQVNLRDFSRFKYIWEICRVHTDKTDVCQFLIFLGVQFFKGAQENAGIALDPDVVDRRILLCESQKKLPFSHTDLDVDRVGISE